MIPPRCRRLYRLMKQLPPRGYRIENYDLAKQDELSKVQDEYDALWREMSASMTPEELADLKQQPY